MNNVIDKEFSVFSARLKVDELQKQIQTLNYNKQFSMLLNNIGKMISELSKLEVLHKHKPKHHSILEKREEILKAIKYLEQLIIVAKLSE